MTPERWKKVEEVFESALEQSPEERSVYLTRVCAGDEALRRQVETLIASYEKAGAFIEEPALGTGVLPETVLDEGVSTLIGRRLGSYKIVREIGRGGMGSVYLAMRADSEFQKRVAIKLIKRGMDTDFIIRRFRNERQILASLDHPNIARLLDGGTTEDGLPYFVMEFVEGQPIHHYCDTQKLSTPQRLRLFLKACSAVEYAHHNLIIHRDLKPSNILVTSEGTPKLLDFGIAKILNPEISSQTLDPTTAALRLMTPEYASPEQVRGLTATTASDVYSLGVLLYELLTGHRPYRLYNRLPEEIARVICEDEPERPSLIINRIEHVPLGNGSYKVELTPESVSKTRDGTPDRLRRQLAGNLDNIIIKALRKEPQRRYATVGEFAEDIRRHLEGQPVSAPAYFIPARFEYELSDTPTGSRAIAVLPFKMLRLEEKTDEYLGLGMADAIITKLSNIRRIIVRPTSSVLKYADGESDLLAAGHELDVGYVLDGRIQRAADRVRVTVQLIRVRDGAPLWAAKFDEKFTDIFTVEDSISGQVAQALMPKLSGEEQELLSKRETENAAAYQAYLKGRYYWNTYTEEGLAQAIFHFMEAIEEDPHYAHAYAGVADYYNWLGVWGVLPPKESFAAAKNAAAKALEIDNTLAEAHTSLAFSLLAYDWDWERSEVEFKRAIELNPSYATAHQWYSLLTGAQGRHAEAITEIEYAQKLDPLSPIIAASAGLTFFNARQYDRSIEELNKALELDPNYFFTHQGLGWSYAQKGRYEEAIASARKAVTLSSRNPLTLWTLGYVLARAGREGEAREVLREMESLREKRYISPYYIAVIYACLDETDAAFEWLERAYEVRDWWLLWLRVEPRIDCLRRDPRFQDLLRRVARDEADTARITITDTGGGRRAAQTRETEAAGALRRWQPSRATLAAAAVALAAVIGLVVFFFIHRAQTRTSSEEAVAGGRTLKEGARSIAVLPFRTVGADGDKQYLGPGLADLLITKLTQLRQITVRPASEVQRYLNSTIEPRQIGRELGVECVLDGELAQTEDRIQVTTRLFSVNDGSLLWSEKFDQKFTDMQTVQDAISERVVRAMLLELTSDERSRLAKHYTENGEAYQLYLVGRYHSGRRTAEGLRQAIQYFEQASKKDQNYALAYAGLADAYGLLPLYEAQPPQESFLKSKEAALKALELDSTLAEAHTSLAYVKLYYDRDLKGADDEFKKAIDLNPNYATAHHWRALSLTASEEFDEALVEIKRAQELDPSSLIINTALGDIYFLAGSYDQAIEQCRKTIEMNPNFMPAHTILRQAYEKRGMFNEAFAEFQREQELSGSNSSPGMKAKLGHLYAATGKRAEALRVVSELLALRKKQFVQAYEIAQIYAMLNEQQKALEWIATAGEEHSFGVAFARVDPDLNNLRNNPEFDELLKRLNLKG